MTAASLLQYGLSWQQKPKALSWLSTIHLLETNGCACTEPSKPERHPPILIINPLGDAWLEARGSSITPCYGLLGCFTVPSWMLHRQACYFQPPFSLLFSSAVFADDRLALCVRDINLDVDFPLNTRLLKLAVKVEQGWKKQVCQCRGGPGRDREADIDREKARESKHTLKAAGNSESSILFNCCVSLTHPTLSPCADFHPRQHSFNLSQCPF